MQRLIVYAATEISVRNVHSRLRHEYILSAQNYNTKKPMLAASMISVVAQPTTCIQRGTANLPMMLLLLATSITTAMTGAARTPLTTALQ